MKYLVSIHRPNGYDGSLESEEMGREISALNVEMINAGIRLFVAGLEPTANARSIRLQPTGETFVTDGPYLESKEFVGGFWVLEAADMDEALGWGRKAAKACRASVEIRPVIQRPPTPAANADQTSKPEA
jgi:hypothetical protein